MYRNLAISDMREAALSLIGILDVTGGRKVRYFFVGTAIFNLLLFIGEPNIETVQLQFNLFEHQQQILPRKHTSRSLGVMR